MEPSKSIPPHVCLSQASHTLSQGAANCGAKRLEDHYVAWCVRISVILFTSKVGNQGNRPSITRRRISGYLLALTGSGKQPLEREPGCSVGSGMPFWCFALACSPHKPNNPKWASFSLKERYLADANSSRCPFSLGMTHE